MGWFSGPIFGELTIFDDNYAVGEKKHVTIWYILWLLYTGLFYFVTLLFLIWGHKNNAADFLFNLLNIGYYKRDIFTCE